MKKAHTYRLGLIALVGGGSLILSVQSNAAGRVHGHTNVVVTGELRESGGPLGAVENVAGTVTIVALPSDRVVRQVRATITGWTARLPPGRYEATAFNGESTIATFVVREHHPVHGVVVTDNVP
jgi:hypothetical protein